MKINRTSRNPIPWNKLEGFLDRNKRVFTKNSGTEIIVGVLTDEKELDQVVKLRIERSAGGGYFLHGRTEPWMPSYVSDIEIYPSQKLALLTIPDKNDRAIFSGYAITLETAEGDFTFLDRALNIYGRAIEHIISGDKQDPVIKREFNRFIRENKNQF